MREPAASQATGQDSGAGAGTGLGHDRADLERKIACPLLVLWGAEGVIERTYDTRAVWRARAEDVRGRALPCGHFLPEEMPEEVARALFFFLRV